MGTILDQPSGRRVNGDVSRLARFAQPLFDLLCLEVGFIEGVPQMVEDPNNCVHVVILLILNLSRASQVSHPARGYLHSSLSFLQVPWPVGHGVTGVYEFLGLVQVSPR